MRPAVAFPAAAVWMAILASGPADGAPAPGSAQGIEKPGQPEPVRTGAADLAPPVPVTAGGRPIEVEGFAAPCVGDFDGDGKTDLLVGQQVLGRLRVYRNVGTKARPVFDRFEWISAGGRIAGVRPCCRVGMTPQLVDLDADGRTDLLTGSGWAGEAYLFRRMPDQTLAEAEVLENRYGQVQMHRWRSSNESHTRRYNVTAFAYDWDADGDADLLLGLSPLCLVLNEGTAGNPSYGDGRLIECDGQPIQGGTGSPLMADWDGDGLDDLLASSQGDIVWYRNAGQRGRPRFEAPRVLLPKAASFPENDPPDSRPGFYHAFCAADFNADGRLDLLVGDHSWRTVGQPGQRESPPADPARLDALREQCDNLNEAPDHETRAERIDRYRRLLRTWQDYEALRLASLAPERRPAGRVWLYERLRTGESISGGLSRFSRSENGTVPFRNATAFSSPILTPPVARNRQGKPSG